MKKLLIALAAVAVSVASFAQGTVTFNTRITGLLDAPVLGANGLGVGPDYSGELFVVSGATPGVIASSKTPFRSGSELAQRYVTTVSEVAIPGVSGPNVTLRFRAYKTSAGSWDAATNDGRGASADFSIVASTLGGGASPPANLVGITGFSVTAVPEPSTIALGVLGAAALLFRRRK